MAPAVVATPAAGLTPPALAPGFAVTNFARDQGISDDLADRWSRLAMTSNQVILEAAVHPDGHLYQAMFLPGITGPLYGPIEYALQTHHPPTRVGTATYTRASFVVMSVAQRAAWEQAVGRPVPGYAVALTSRGPAMLQFPGGTTAILATASEVTTLIPGVAAHDPVLGDVWQRAGQVVCDDLNPQVSDLCGF